MTLIKMQNKMYSVHLILTYNEVMWFYASANSDQIDRMVIYNYAENLWYIGTLARTSWSDYGVYPVPYATQFKSTDTTATISTITGLKAGRTFVFLHETGTEDDGSAMANHIESGDIDIADGDNFMSISRFIPDFKNLTGTADVTIKTRPYPSGTQTSHGSFDVTTSTTKVNTRIRGRQVAVRISSDATGDKWRYGTMRLDIRPDGMRFEQAANGSNATRRIQDQIKDLITTSTEATDDFNRFK